VADSHDSAVVDVLIELKQSGLDAAKDVNDQLKDLNATVKDVNSSLEKMSDRAHQDAAALLGLGAAATVAKGAAGGAGVMGFIGGLAQMMPGGTVMGYAILGVLGLAGALAPFVVVLAAAIVLTTAFLAGVATLATVAFIGFGGIAALAAGMVYLGNRTTAGHAALVELGTDLTTMADVLSKKATPMMIQMVNWMDRFIPQIQKAGLDLITWFGQRLPALFPIMTNVVNTLAGAFGQILGAIGKVIDYVISHPQFLAWFDGLVKIGAAAVVGLLANLLRLSDWFLQRMPAIAAIALPIFGGIGNVIQGIGTVFGNIVDYFLKKWPDFVTAAQKAGQFFSAIWNNPSIQEGLRELKGMLKDVIDHLYELQPIIPLIAGAMVGLTLAVMGLVGGLLELVRALEAVSANAGAIQDRTPGGIISNWWRQNNPFNQPNPNALQLSTSGNTVLPPSKSTPGASSGSRPQSFSGGGTTILPVAFVTVPPSRDQAIAMAEAIRRLQRSVT
jgi:hypothetical protein